MALKGLWAVRCFWVVLIFDLTEDVIQAWFLDGESTVGMLDRVDSLRLKIDYIFVILCC